MKTKVMSIGTQIKSVMKNDPMKFQIRGIRFLEKSRGRAILGDDMGLGKTYQAAAYMALHSFTRPVIIVCQASLKYLWQEQLKTHANIESTVLEGRNARREDLEGDIWIINYDILHSWRNVLRITKPKLLILDECHHIKTRKAQRTKACQTLGKLCPHILALSGTPIISRPIEFFTTLNMIDPKEFNSFWEYAFRYCAPKRAWRGRGWNFNGASHTDELHERISRIMIRRMKTEVLKDLPKKTRTIIPVTIDNPEEYKEAKTYFLNWLTEKKGTKAAKKAKGALALVRLGALKRLVAQGKMYATIEWIKDWLQNTNEKLVVFAVHRAIIASLKQTFPKAALIDGSVSVKNRQKEIARFQTNKTCRLFLGNIKAAGEGITLHAASTVLFIEIGWTPAEHDQAEDRVLRIGQTADHVSVYYLIGKDTLEEDILDLINEKREICNQILDGGNNNRITTIVLDRLLKKGKGL